MKFKIRCRSLEEIERYSNQQVACGTPSLKDSEQPELLSFNIARLQAYKMGEVDAFISLPTALIDDNIKLGDMFEVEIRKV